MTRGCKWRDSTYGCDVQYTENQSNGVGERRWYVSYISEHDDHEDEATCTILDQKSRGHAISGLFLSRELALA